MSTKSFSNYFCFPEITTCNWPLLFTAAFLYPSHACWVPTPWRFKFPFSNSMVMGLLFSKTYTRLRNERSTGCFGSSLTGGLWNGSSADSFASDELEDSSSYSSSESSYLFFRLSASSYNSKIAGTAYHHVSSYNVVLILHQNSFPSFMWPLFASSHLYQLYRTKK